jgi:hypothetical protein
MKTADAKGDEWGDRGDRSSTELEALVREYESVGIGPVILQEVRDVIRSVVRGYDPVVYGQVASWELGLEDLAQEFGVDVLVTQGQLDYAITVAGDRLHFRRLIARQLRYLLARRRRRTIVDNLLDRAKKRVAKLPFRLVASRSEWSYTLADKDVAPGRVSQAERRTLAFDLSRLPIIRAQPSRRAPTVYSEDTLERILESVADSVPCAVRVADLDGILGLMLTPWVPTFIKDGERALARAEAGGLDAEQQAIARQVARQVIGGCPAGHQEVLRLKLGGASDREVAVELALSRPTASKRKREAMNVLERELGGLDSELRVAVMDALGTELARRLERDRNGRV